MKYAIAVALTVAIVIAVFASYVGAIKRQETADRIELMRKQINQLQHIIKRCGAELCMDKDGNYDAIIPMTPEEFEEFKKQIRERN